MALSELQSQAPRALGEPPVTAILRASPEDFRVSERLGFELSGDGPHEFVYVEKRGVTTLALIDALAKFAGARARDLGYSGLKDRDAVTRQWLSLPYAPDRDWQGFASDEWRVVKSSRNARKLRVGAHRSNAFTIVLRGLQGDGDSVRKRIDQVIEQGVPNYFGPQRFGRHGDNLRRAHRWFVDGVKLGRRQRRFALSAARSALFNRVLAERVRRGDWLTPMHGEPMCLDGSGSHFDAATESPERLRERLAAHDVHTSGPLWGGDGSTAAGECAQFERAVASSVEWLATGLAGAGVAPRRRALRLSVRSLAARIDDDALTLDFELVRGAFATSVVHELAKIDGLSIPC